MNFEKYFSSLMNNAALEKLWKNARKHKNNKLVTAERRRKYLVSEPHYHCTNFFTEKLLAIEIRKTQILMKKPAYLILSILELTKTVNYKFWYDYVKQQCNENTKLCYMDTDSFIVYERRIDTYKGITEDVKTKLGTSTLGLERQFPKEKNKKVIGLSEWIMKQFGD